MTKGPCLCGDTECPSCGSAMGTYNPPEVEYNYACDACGKEGYFGLCPKCEEEMAEMNREDNFRDDVEADADTLKSAGYGTDEDYGYFGDEEY